MMSSKNRSHFSAICSKGGNCQSPGTCRGLPSADYPTRPKTMATTNRNAAVKIVPWSTA
ncbi:hypothetical protein AMC85_CH04264 [Rhizobium phaseoli]|nr:hypothetical protein AMC88_CH04267 [Rhizobium phaseoli]ANL61584.1 hypothetical protein AMC85_CH04264 [Rhizobium phaseoli]ANL93397.1 hypothetical protein AMC80_CH04179 [Rhizobium phaseoli]